MVKQINANMANYLNDFEDTLLINENCESNFFSYELGNELVNEYITNAFEKLHFKIITNPLSCRILFGSDNSENVFMPENYDSFKTQILKNIYNYFEENSQNEKLLILLSLGVSCLQFFVKSNWICCHASANENFFFNTESLNSILKKDICIDGEFIHPLTRNISLLIISKIIFSYLCENPQFPLLTCKLWLVRCVWIFQQLLNERSPTFKQIVMEFLPQIENDLSSKKIEDSNQLLLQYYVESVHILYFYYEPNLAKLALESAINISKLSVQLTGVMGKRTKFQSKDISQLSLEVKNNSNNFISNPDKILPKNIALEDESLLNKMMPADNLSQVKLDSNKQALILAMCYYHKRNCEGHSSVIKEEIMAYIDFVLEQPQNWCVQMMALFLRSHWQNEGFRYIHRSLQQLEELIHHQKSIKCEDKLDYKFSINLPPSWMIQLELGTLRETVGAMDGALEVYEELQMYENIIKCHLMLSNKNKAESIIRNELLKKETAELYCYLGDVTQNEEYYLKSWTISNGRYSKAQRSLAYLNLRNKNYKESLQYFEKSLEINPLQISTWFSYGCASLSCLEYEKAAVGFRRCVNLDSDNFEAWNNLATAYIRSGDKARAFLTLQEAIKCSYDNWRLWENYLLVSVDTGHFEEGIKSYHRLLDLKQKHVDIEVLTILVKAVEKNLLDAKDSECKNFIQKMLQLFGRISSKIINDADVWSLYSRVISCNPEGDLNVKEEKMLQCLQKSHRCLMSNRGWETNIDECNDVVQKTIALASLYENQIKKAESTEMKCKLISSAKLSINNFILQIKKFHSDFVTETLKQPLLDSVESLEVILREIISKDSS